MKNPAKLITSAFVVFGAIAFFLTGESSSRIGATEVAATPTASAATPKASPTVTAPAPPASAIGSPVKSAPPENPAGASISKTCCDLDASAYKGVVRFDHDAHALNISYSSDGKSPARCIECHHTDQPRTGGLMSERTVELTYAAWSGLTDRSVKNCKICHISRNDPPEIRPKFNDKEISDNYDAYHENCTVCHASAAKARNSLLGKPRFATKVNQCYTCHAGE